VYPAPLFIYLSIYLGVPCSPVYLSEDEEEELSPDYLTINGNQRNLGKPAP